MASAPPIDRLGYRRWPSLEVRVGALTIGGNHPVVLQSMCTTRTTEVEATIRQSIVMAEAGCEMVGAHGDIRGFARRLSSTCAGAMEADTL